MCFKSGLNGRDDKLTSFHSIFWELDCLNFNLNLNKSKHVARRKFIEYIIKSYGMKDVFKSNEQN